MKSNGTKRNLPSVVVFACLMLFGPSAAQAVTTVTVPGTADIWLAGMPDGTTALHGDVVPGQAPVLVPGLSLNPGTRIVFFGITGTVNNHPGMPMYGPEGDSVHIESTSVDDFFWKSKMIAPTSALVGVFLDDSVPSGPVPATLDFATAASREFLALAPALRQTFFIGDGLTGGGVQQDFWVPAGATRLFLGTEDGSGGSANNSGSFVVNAEEHVVPEPLTMMGVLLGIGALSRYARKRIAVGCPT